MENFELQAGDIQHRNISECENCGEIKDSDHFKKIGENWYCDDCAENFVECVNCGADVHCDSTTDCNGDTYCEYCAGDLLFSCARCDEISLLEDAVEVYDQRDRSQTWCRYCADNHAFTCEHCGDVHDDDCAISLDSGGYVCEGCYSDNYFTCDNCGYVFHIDNSYDDNGNIVCESCYEGNSENIHNYHHKPMPVFHKTEGEGECRKYGVELETEGDCDCAGELLEMSDDENLFWLEHDSSLNHGFELVTHPCSLAYHQKEFPWKNITTYLREHGFKSHDTTTCGLHIHVSRKGLTATDQIKIGLFVGFNYAKLKVFGRRDYNHYCKQKQIEKGKLKDVVYSPDRYEAVNFTNRNTIEFRFFKGTLKMDTIMASVEFVDALCAYVKQNGFPTINRPCWNEFVAFCQKDKTYNTLVSYMDHRNLL